MEQNQNNKISIFFIIEQIKKVCVFLNTDLHIQKIIQELSIHNPFHIAEILTMWKIGIFRIHPVANLKATCIWQKHTAFESEKIAFALSCMKLHFVSHMTLALFVYLENHQLNAYHIIQTLLINNKFHPIILATLKLTCNGLIESFNTDNINIIPSLCHLLFPQCNL